MSGESDGTSRQSENLAQVLIDIQDRLVPVLDTYEQAIYRYIFRHTVLAGRNRCHFRTRSAEIGLGSGNRNTPPSMASRSKKLRSLAEKGAVRVIERSRDGILVEIMLPDQIPSLAKEQSEVEVDLDALDFFRDARLRSVILEREQSRCFYLGRKITEDNFCLDHVVSQAECGDNSYRNVVATCYDANSMKNDQNAEEFVRYLYREGLLSIDEMKGLQDKIRKLADGLIRPDESLVRRALAMGDESA